MTQTILVDEISQMVKSLLDLDVGQSGVGCNGFDEHAAAHSYTVERGCGHHLEQLFRHSSYLDVVIR